MNTDRLFEEMFGDDFPVVKSGAKSAKVGVEEFVRRAVLQPKDVHLSPRQAGRLMGLGPDSIRRFYHGGMFPNAYMLNPRVIRIPESDVLRCIEERKRPRY